MKTCFNHNFSKSANAQILQKASGTAISHIHERNWEIAGFNQKMLFSAIHSAAENALQNKPETITSPNSTIFHFFQNEKCFMFHVSHPRRGAAFFWPNLPRDLVDLNSEHFAKLQDSLISQSYDQNKFSTVLLKENAFFWKKKLKCSSGEPITSPAGGVFLRRLMVILDPDKSWKSFKIFENFIKIDENRLQRNAFFRFKITNIGNPGSW